MNQSRRPVRLGKNFNRLPSPPASRRVSPFSKTAIARALRVLAPTLFALTFASIAHAQGTMYFSGAQTLMGTFKTFYKAAEVSLDFEDYLWNAPYARCVAKQRMDKVDALHDSYLAAADQYIDIYRSLSRRLYGHDIPYVLLLHVTAFNAKMLPDLIAQLRERGLTFITLSEALRDPAYTIDPAIGYPGGGPIQEELAVARKLPFPPAVKPNEWLEKTCK